MESKLLQPFSIIRYRGEPKKATTLHGETVFRADQLLIPEWGAFVKCAPYDDQFIYANSADGEPSYMCTCGSVAVVVPPSPEGLMVCLQHQTFGYHTTGGSRWI